MSERDVMLGRIREALQAAYLPDAQATLPPLSTPPEPRGRATKAWVDLAGQFIASLEAVGGEVLRAADEATARERIIELIREVGATEALVWPDEELPVAVGNSLAAAGITAVSAQLGKIAGVRRRQLEKLDRVVVGVTGALAGLADTGSLALLSGERRPMISSLLPLIHIAILREGDLLPDMATFLARHPAETLTAASRNLVFITGPSRTADIEMIITRGVHGPKRLVVILLAE